MTLILPGGIIGGGKVPAWSQATTSDRLTRSGVLSGSAASSSMTISLWVRLTGGDSATLSVVSGTQSGGVRLALQRTVANDFQFTCAPAGTSTPIIAATAVGPFLSSSNYYHVIASCNASTARCLVNGTVLSDLVFGYQRSAGDVPFNVMDEFVIPPSGGTVSDLAEVWLDDSYLDLTVEANYRKFIKANGKPEKLGANGASPTGSSPLIYLRGPVATLATNRGTGGDFTVTGTLTDAATSPSD